MRVSRRIRRAGFTVADLLAVGGVLALFAFLVFPVWVGSLADARRAACAGNLAQVGRAAAIYATGHKDQWPGNQHSQPSWVQSLSAYFDTNSYRCPEERLGAGPARAYTIALNDFLTPHPYGARKIDYSLRPSVPAPAETLLFAEETEDYRDYDHFHFADAEGNGYGLEAFADQVDVERHSGEANYLFSDGHVDALAWNHGVRPRLGFPRSRFVHPAGAAVHPEFAGR